MVETQIGDKHKQLCYYCFENLETFLDKKEVLDYDKSFDEMGEHPIFVSYHKNESLRGCIGTFKPDKLGK